GEYIVITNLPDNTHYTLKEVNSDRYLTQYQRGTHKHVDGNQVDILEGGVKYSYLADNNPDPISAKDYNYVRFTNGPVIKTEISPGDGAGVQVGDEIVYDIEWANDQQGNSDIVITDTLDEGLDFVGARFGSGENAGDWWDGEGTFTSPSGNTITCDEHRRTITWTRHSQEEGASGIVSLKVIVNEKALKEEETEGKFGTNTPRVENYAVLVNNETKTELKTNTVENPVWEPIKNEIDPGQGVPVVPQKVVTYTISWKNYLNEPAGVVVRDPLDFNVEYVPDSAQAFYGDYSQENESSVETAAISTFTDANDGNRTVIKWDLGEQAAGAEGYVTFQVKVKESAISEGVIWNWGYVQIGNKPEIETNHIDNPILSYELPYAGGIGTTVFMAGGCAMVFGSLLAGYAILRRRKSNNH
ncbi:MAG: DUF11 domain-containing protein, partial [Clostridiales bacterium]|nr:DUF11 domain-containing protein [Clostridiales bacterium]